MSTRKWSENADATLKAIEKLEKNYPKVVMAWCKTGGHIFRLIDFAFGVIILRPVLTAADQRPHSSLKVYLLARPSA